MCTAMVVCGLFSFMISCFPLCEVPTRWWLPLDQIRNVSFYRTKRGGFGWSMKFPLNDNILPSNYLNDHVDLLALDSMEVCAKPL
jgi:hypothetical protein